MLNLRPSPLLLLPMLPRMWLVALLWLGVAAAQASTLKAYTEEFAPFNYTRNGQHLGLANQILERVAQESGIRIERFSLPWLRAVQANQQEPDSIIYTMVRTPARDKQYVWVGPYDDCDLVMMRLKPRTDIVIQNLKDAERYVLGAPRGAAGIQTLQNAGFNMKRVDTTSAEENRTVKMLFAQRFDLSVGLLIPHIFSARELGLDASQIVPAFTLAKGYGCYFAFNPMANPNLVSQFRAAYQRLQERGEIERIRQQYLANPGQNATPSVVK